jgi:hypothetical protein
MIADQVKEWFIADKGSGTVQGVTVAPRLWLGYKLESGGKAAGGGAERILIAGKHDEADLFATGATGFFEDDLQGGLGSAVAVDESLQRQGTLRLTCGGNDSFANSHR